MEASDPGAFRRLELALIQLNDERRGGVITQDQYIARYRRMLEESGFTAEDLEQAPVWAPDKEGKRREADLTWDKLRYRRRSREPADEGT